MQIIPLKDQECEFHLNQTRAVFSVIIPAQKSRRGPCGTACCRNVTRQHETTARLRETENKKPQ